MLPNNAYKNITTSNIPLRKSPQIINFFLLTLSATSPAIGANNMLGIIPKAIIDANLPADPVILST